MLLLCFYLRPPLKDDLGNVSTVLGGGRNASCSQKASLPPTSVLSSKSGTQAAERPMGGIAQVSLPSSNRQFGSTRIPSAKHCSSSYIRIIPCAGLQHRGRLRQGGSKPSKHPGSRLPAPASWLLEPISHQTPADPHPSLSNEGPQPSPASSVHGEPASQELSAARSLVPHPLHPLPPVATCNLLLAVPALEWAQELP